MYDTSLILAGFSGLFVEEEKGDLHEASGDLVEDYATGLR